jgi:S1-C subfamily serine protease
MKPATIIIAAFLLAQLPIQLITALPINNPTTIAQSPDGVPTPQETQAAAKNITVRVNSRNNSGSGVIIAQKGSSYLILTNAHIVNRSAQLEIQAPDGQKYQATAINGGFDTKYDLALLQFTSKTKYALANLADVTASPIDPTRTIYSAGFPLNAQTAATTSGEVSQISDLPLANGTQFGFTIDKGKQGIDMGMSGGAILDTQGNLLGINAVSAAPNYTYSDGSKPIPKLIAQYQQANWGIPIYNFLTHVKPEIVASYNLPKLDRQVTPTGSLAKLNDSLAERLRQRVRHLTVRIENSDGNGSGVIIAREGSSYYVLTAKYVIQDDRNNNRQKFTNTQIITADQDRHNVTSSIVAEGVDLAVVKFTSNNSYPIAEIANYDPTKNDRVFVGGYPSRSQISSPFWQWQLSPGVFLSRVSRNKSPDYQIYDLIYNNVTYGGMTGAAVFDAEAKVIGIHFAAEAIDRTNTGERLGISSQTVLKSLEKLQVRSGLLKISQRHPS